MAKDTLVCSDAFTATFNSVAIPTTELISVVFDAVGKLNGMVNTSAAGDTVGTQCSQNKVMYEPCVITKFFQEATDSAIAYRTNAELVITYSEGSAVKTWTAWAVFAGGNPVTVERDQDEASGIELTFELTNVNDLGAVTAPAITGV